jgi:signal peptidase I
VGRLLARIRGNTVFELVLLVAVALGLALAVQAYAVKPYRIPSASMEPTLQVGDRVLVNRVSHRLGSDPQVGQIVVFHPPLGAEASPPVCGAAGEGQGTRTPCSTPTRGSSSQTFIKRVVGVGGDSIALRDGHVVRNGKWQREPYIRPCEGDSGCNLPHPSTVPDGFVYVLGTTGAPPTTAVSGVPCECRRSSARP